MAKVPLDTEPKLKGHNIFRRRPRHSITYVLFTSCLQGLRLINLHPPLSATAYNPDVPFRTLDSDMTV